MRIAMRIIALFSVIILILAVITGCAKDGSEKNPTEPGEDIHEAVAQTEKDGSKYHLSETLLKYADVSAEAKQAILAFAEKYDELEERFDTAETPYESASLSIEVCDAFTELNTEYLEKLFSELKEKCDGLSKDDAAECQLFLYIPYNSCLIDASELSLDCIDYKYGMDTSREHVEKMAQEALELYQEYLSVLTLEGTTR